MPQKFRVRFVGSQRATPDTPTCETTPRLLDHPNRRRKSRFACQECKQRHLKCDETFPVCLRCKQRGITCRSAFRSVQWQLEVPGLTIERHLSNIPSSVDSRLLQYWLEKASQVMVIDPNNNPFSFGILKYFESSPSLIHTVQALSLAHENFFSSLSVEDILQEKDHALRLVQEELREGRPAHGSLLTVVLLGLCSAWVYQKPDGEFGKEHLHGTRAILDILLAEPGSEEDAFIQQGVATYLGWDQAAAFLLSAEDQIPHDSDDLVRCVTKMRNKYNPTIGYTIELMYLLGKVGRYCRAIIDGGFRDVTVEAWFEEQLMQSESADMDDSSYHVNNAYRKHGLIMLYRAIQSAITSDFLHSTADYIGPDCSTTITTTTVTTTGGTTTTTTTTTINNNANYMDYCYPNNETSDIDGCYPTNETDYIGGYYPTNEIIRQYAKDILGAITELPETSYYHSLLSLPLFTAASELTKDDVEDRQDVRNRFQKLFSSTRLPVNLCALEFLEDLWELHDNGYQGFWLTYLLEKAWVFVLC